MTVTGNHFPCDCRLNSWLSASLFANQSKGHVMNNNYCISPYEVHGKTVMSAANDFALLEACAPETEEDAGQIDDELAVTTEPSNLSSSATATVHKSFLIILSIQVLIKRLEL